MVPGFRWGNFHGRTVSFQGVSELVGAASELAHPQPSRPESGSGGSANESADALVFTQVVVSYFLFSPLLGEDSHFD